MVLPHSKGPMGDHKKNEYKRVAHDENQHEQGQGGRQSGAPNTSVVSEEIRFEGEVNGPFMEKMCPGEVSNHEN